MTESTQPLQVKATARLIRALAAGALIAMISATQPALAADPPIPVADFVRVAQFGDPQLSPDGKHLVVSRVIEKNGRDTTVMVVYDLSNMSIVSTVGMPLYEVPVQYTWITNQRLVVSVGREYGSLEAPKLTGELLSMNLDGRNQEYLYGRSMYLKSKRGITMADDEGWGSVAYVPEPSTGHFLMTENLWGRTAQTSRLFDVEATTAARRLVTEIGRPGFGFVMQNDGVPRFAVGNDDSAFYSVYRYDDITHAWSELAGSDRGNLLPQAILSGDHDLIATLSVGGGPEIALQQSLFDGKRTVLAADKVASMNRFEWTARPRAPFAVEGSVDIPKPRYIGGEGYEAKLHKTLSEQFPGSNVHFVSFSENGKMVFVVRSDRDAGTFYLFDRATQKASLLFTQMSWIDPDKMAERRPIKFNARDGIELHGYLTLPALRGDAKLPLILLPHGGPYGISDTWFFNRDAQFLASRGYAVLQVNFRGSGGRGAAFETAGHRQWGGLMQRDLIDGVKWVVGTGVADGDRVCSYGGSFGAYSALMVAILEPTLFKCAVGYSGVYDLAQMYDEYETRRDKRRYNYLVKVIGEDPAELTRFSPARHADKLTVPVLLVHGSRDERTPPLQAETMRDALTKAGHPPEWMYVDGEGHGFYTVANRKAFYERLEKFFAKNLGK